VIFEICEWTDKHTDMLTTVLCTPTMCKVIMKTIQMFNIARVNISVTVLDIQYNTMHKW